MAQTKQFDLSHIRVSEELQGARLASFSRRAAAYGIDWAIITFFTQMLWLIIPLSILLAISRKKLKRTMRVGNYLLHKNVKVMDFKLSEVDIQTELRQRFARYITVYLYLLIYAPIVLSVFLFIAVIIGWASPTGYGTLKAGVGDVGNFIQPLVDIFNGFELLQKFIGAGLYFSLFTWRWEGQTPGKRLMRIRAVKLNGRPLTYWNSLERATGYAASASLAFVGFFQYFWEQNHQTTHDKITETIVVQE